MSSEKDAKLALAITQTIFDRFPDSSEFFLEQIVSHADAAVSHEGKG